MFLLDCPVKTITGREGSKRKEEVPSDQQEKKVVKTE